jgi:hypothetical protein
MNAEHHLVETAFMRVVATGDKCPEHGAQDSERQSHHSRINQRPQRILAEIGRADQCEPDRRNQT